MHCRLTSPSEKQFHMPSLTLLTLNMEADRHLDRVSAAIAAHAPDIVCLQEALAIDCVRLAETAGYRMKFALSARMPTGRRGALDWGIAVLTRVPVIRQTIAYYADDPRIRVFETANDPRRLILITELEHRGRRYRIATTHFTWSPDGEIVDEQRADFVRLERALAPYPDYVLCGDFNAPRGREMFAKFTDELHLIDHLPRRVTTTIDADLHRAGDLQLVVDTIFSTSHYRVTDVKVLSGLSDHMGILATVEGIAAS